MLGTSAVNPKPVEGCRGGLLIRRSLNALMRTRISPHHMIDRTPTGQHRLEQHPLFADDHWNVPRYCRLPIRVRYRRVRSPGSDGRVAACSSCFCGRSKSFVNRIDIGRRIRVTAAEHRLHPGLAFGPDDFEIPDADGLAILRPPPVRIALSADPDAQRQFVFVIPPAEHDVIARGPLVGDQQAQSRAASPRVGRRKFALGQLQAGFKPRPVDGRLIMRD